MPANPPEQVPRTTPCLLEQDIAGALERLARVFGLRERMRLPVSGGAVMRAEARPVRDVAPEHKPPPPGRHP